MGETRQPADEASGLYAHLPFCRQQCSYCDFFTVQTPAPMDRFVAALLLEIDAIPRPSGGLRTIYFGGGTPSLLPAADIARLLAAVRERFGPARDEDGSAGEITLEGDPGDLTTGYLRAVREAGVNRLSIGLQTLDDGLLEMLGRCHDRDAGIQSVERARAAGFDNLSVDLIRGLPGQPVARWLEVLERTLELEPEHLSCYELSFEPGTPLDRARRAGRVTPPSERERQELFAATAERLAEHGYEHYEVSSFAREPRFRARHNSAYWTHRPYLGLGPSAHGFDGRERTWNHRSLRRYLADVEAGRPPVEGRETLSDEQRADEAVMLGLRTSDGFALEGLAAGARAELDRLVAEGHLVVDGDRARPTRTGLALADHLALRLTS